MHTHRRAWTEASIKLQLLTEGGDACSLLRRSERNIFYKYYGDEEEDSLDSPSRSGGGYDAPVSKALSTPAMRNQMKFNMR